MGEVKKARRIKRLAHLPDVIELHTQIDYEALTLEISEKDEEAESLLRMLRDKGDVFFIDFCQRLHAMNIRGVQISAAFAVACDRDVDIFISRIKDADFGLVDIVNSICPQYTAVVNTLEK